MNLYLDASALAKRYTREAGRDDVVAVMERSDGWLISRVGLVETAITVNRAAGEFAASIVERERRKFEVIELTEAIEHEATRVAAEHGLRSLDAIHLASALQGRPHFTPVMASWDHRLRAAAAAEGLELFPETLD